MLRGGGRRLFPVFQVPQHLCCCLPTTRPSASFIIGSSRHCSSSGSREVPPVKRRFKIGIQYEGRKYAGFTALRPQLLPISRPPPTPSVSAAVDSGTSSNTAAESIHNLLDIMTSKPHYSLDWQQKGEHHLQVGVLDLVEHALHLMTKHTGGFSHIKASSRTDAGVHALRNVFSVDLHHHKFTSENIQKSLNYYLQSSLSEIYITDVEEVSLDFDARIDATSRTYMYKFLIQPSHATVVNSATKLVARSKLSLFHQQHAWIVDPFHHQGTRLPFNIHHFIEACQYLIGEHDFSSFRNSKCQSNSPFRELYFIEIFCNDIMVARVEGEGKIEYFHPNPNELLLHTNTVVTSTDKGLQRSEQIKLLEGNISKVDVIIKGDSFLLRMVRNIMGVLVQIGQGLLTPEDMRAILQIKDRSQVKISPAPAHGLYLLDVEYDTDMRKIKEERIKSRLSKTT